MNQTRSPVEMSVQYLKGVGPRRAAALMAEGITTVGDLLEYAPRAYIERTAQRSLRALARQLLLPDLFGTERETVSVLRSEVSIIATVERIMEKQFASRRRLLEAIIRDDDGTRGALLFWNAHEYYRRILQPGASYIITGVPELDRLRRITFTHPQLERIEEEEHVLLEHGILPLYRITENMRACGITLGMMRRLARTALDTARDALVELLPPAVVERYQLPSRATALEHLHFPPSGDHLARARARMKFEEVFLFELLLAVNRETLRQGIAPQIPPHSPRWQRLVERLPFTLTAAQQRAIETIAADMARTTPMHRLLHGDVGAGKTLVALAAMLAAVDAGYQTLLAVPTEVLAEQHWRTISRLTSGLDVQVVKLVGSQTTRQRQVIAAAISSGMAQIIVGTHALFADSTSTGAQQYHRVGLVVIDEQHRFGVAQRAQLRHLAIASHPERLHPHMLVMSATPIPRTLTMTLYGDLDVSQLDQMPPGRQPVRTCVIGRDQLQSAYEHIRSEVRAGRQAFIIYPLVDESDKLEIRAATTEFERLAREHFSTERLALLHGQMGWNEKEAIMEQFARGDFDILVATTVVEVGIDVPNATVMLIEHAERFGLAQLHQLRGRVGRGTAPATCYLVTERHIAARVHLPPSDDEPPSVTRLRTMEQTTNGFLIAEADLRLRGPGDILGTRQAGLPEFRYVDLVQDAEIIAAARQEAFALIERDPHLRSSEHAALRSYVLRRVSQTSHFALA
ncbi:MAG: ATP-dependent DNA helicase RecG [Bacteroidota bacterium]|nr:ATP-dependent DNA helicase RecG [Candidatus Kapabacteria bacterium]MDW8272064.1 ATP-dependent DNA helicase RecG [Bacteroidota bacterium]